MKIIWKKTWIPAASLGLLMQAPAFAIDYNSDSFILQERGANDAQQTQVQAQPNAWTDAYAMEGSAWVDRSPYANRGAAEVNGGM